MGAAITAAQNQAAASAPTDETDIEGADARLAVIGRVLSVIVPLVVWFVPLGLEPVTQHAFAILGFMVTAWMTRALDFALTGFIGCFLFWALKIVKFPVAFSGFANETPWFLFGALLIGVIATRSGIARRIAYFIMLRVGVTYPRILFGLIATDFLLTFIVPSGIARLVIMASIALGLAEAFKAERGSNVARGMFLVLTYTANIFDKMIIAGAGSITASGLMQKVGGIEVLWSQWLLAFLPCSIITVFAAWRLTLWMFPPEKVRLEGGKAFLREELAKMGGWTPLEIRSALLMAFAILMWLTDFWHHISPAVVGVGVGLFALLPPVKILDMKELRKLNYLPVFFTAAAVSMGTVLEQTHGLDILTNAVFGTISPYFTNIIMMTTVMYWTAFLYHFLLASEISMLATSIPLVMEFAKSHAMHPLQLGLIWTFAAGGKLFAYQSGVLIVGYSYGYFRAIDLIKMGAWLTVIEFIVLVLMVPLYWPLIGIQ